mgnify:CR=1 FL=1
MNGTFTEMARAVMANLTEFGFDLVGALIIVIVGWMVASWAERATRKAVDKTTRVDSTLKPILGHIARYGILIFAGIAILAQFGIETASLLTVLGTAGLAIGLALQGTLRDLAAGFMILTHRPFRVEDHIEFNKLDGIVKHVGPFITVLETRDGVYLSVPNSTIWSNPISNNTRNPTRRVQIVFRVDYDEDIDRVFAVLEEELKADSRVLADPKTMVAVQELAENSVNVVARAWTASSEFRKFSLDFTKRIKKRFDQEGIKIPYPHRAIRIERNVKRPELQLVPPEPEIASDPSSPTGPVGPAE